MKILLGLVFVFALAVNSFGQTKKPNTKTEIASSIQTSTKVLLLQTQKKAREEKLEQLRVSHSDDYSENKTLIEEINSLNKEITKLLILELPSNAMEIFQADLNTNDLMKILIVQNQKIIELLEKLDNKK